EAKGLGPDDLLFTRNRPVEDPCLQAVPDPEDLEFTAPNGRRYSHATMTAYNLGKCKCALCRGAYADYRAKRRNNGKDSPRKLRIIDDDPHISATWFRTYVWLPAHEAADLGFNSRVHDLRHAHASWLLAGGADLQVVKERLGHLKLSTTERYLHSLPTADETALAALDKIRNADKETTGEELEAAQAEISRLKAVIADRIVAQHLDEQRHLRPA
ncbi:MAG: putative Tyrosine recombinase xerD, partial [Actinomycetia bacterium]|nr:putative Tyrosine recombinase xerD [Actinomycetes bacterium]